MGYQSNSYNHGRHYISTKKMIIKSLTKQQLSVSQNPILNELWSIDDLIYTAQLEGLTEINFNPPLQVHKDVTKVFSSNPYNFAVTETNLPNNMVSLTKINWQ